MLITHPRTHAIKTLMLLSSVSSSYVDLFIVPWELMSIALQTTLFTAMSHEYLRVYLLIYAPLVNESISDLI